MTRWRRGWLGPRPRREAARYCSSCLRATFEIVRGTVALLNAGNWDDLIDLYDPDVEFCDLRSAVDAPQVVSGAQAVKTLLIAWSEAFEDFGSEVYELIDADPHVSTYTERPPAVVATCSVEFCTHAAIALGPEPASARFPLPLHSPWTGG